MSESNHRKEIKRTARLLENMKQLASEASMTGSLSGSAKVAAQQYNAILERLEQLGEIPGSLFPRLSSEAAYDEVGFAAAQLAAYLDVEEEAESSGNQFHGPHNSPTFIINAPLGGEEGLEGLKNLGQIIRENLPDWLKGEKIKKTSEAEAAAPAPPPPPGPPAPPPPHAAPKVAMAALPADAHPAQFVPDPATVRQAR